MSADATTLDYALAGRPAVRAATGSVDTTTLDLALAGRPFVAQTEGPVTHDVTITETVALADSETVVKTVLVARTETLSLSDSAVVVITRPVYVTEVLTLADSSSTIITELESTVSAGVQALDFVFHAQAFARAGAPDTMTLDYALGARPFVITTIPFTGRIEPSIKIYSDPQML